MSEKCIFCCIASGQIESDILYRDDSCFVVRDIAPKAPVHLLIIPNHHFTYLTGLAPEHYQMLGGMFQVAKEMAQCEGVSNSGYRLIINQGKDAGQEVSHLHLHLLGKKPLGPLR